jgi:hypothetical protein
MTRIKFFVCVFALIYSFIGSVNADSLCNLNLTTAPTCAALGYTRTASCPEGYVTCPFNSAYKWCKTYTCADGRYESKNLDSCVAVSYHGLGCYDCSCSGYTLDSCPTGAVCSECAVNNTKYYQVKSCEDDYIAQRDDTTQQLSCQEACAGYSLSTCPTNGTCSTCLWKGTRYSLDECDDGYLLTPDDSCELDT